MACRLMPALALLAALASGCGPRDAGAEDDSRPVVVVTTAYLGAAAADLLGDTWRIASLQPPGHCPGHFDTTPDMFRLLARSRLVLRFDFQSGVDATLSGFNQLAIGIVDAPQGMAIPATFAAVARDAHRHLAEAASTAEREALDARLAELEDRLNALDEEIRHTARERGLTGLKVVASGHQATFCRYLGMDVVGQYGSTGAESPREAHALIEAGQDARLIVATVQEGLQQARFVSEQLGGVPVAPLNNIPASLDAGAFDAMVRANLQTIIDELSP